VVLGGCAYWASLAFGHTGTGKQRSLVPKWRRPSTLLIVLAFCICIYTRSVTRVTVMIAIAAFALMAWESDAFADVDIRESDVDQARDEVLAASATEKDERPDEDDDFD
jgi:hypothetical protein